jgi:hypothetical protein
MRMAMWTAMRFAEILRAVGSATRLPRRSIPRAVRERLDDLQRLIELTSQITCSIR